MIRGKINKIEKINGKILTELKLFFEKSNMIDSLLSRLVNKKEKTQNTNIRSYRCEIHKKMLQTTLSQ